MEEITGVILAGGRAQRMGGVDKGLISLCGRPMIEYVMDALSNQVDSTMISANRNNQRYRDYGHPVIPDQIDGFAGPLAGIHAALSKAPTELVLTVPCDGPWLPGSLAVRLLQQLRESEAQACVAHDGESLQPVYGLFRRELLFDIETFLTTGERKLRHWLARTGAVTVDFSDCPQAFTNVNTPEERDRVEALLRAAGNPVR